MQRAIQGLIVFFVLTFCATAMAQKPIKGTNPSQAKAAVAATKATAVRDADLRDLIQTLENEAERKKLITRLNTMIEAKKRTQTQGIR